MKKLSFLLIILTTAVWLINPTKGDCTMHKEEINILSKTEAILLAEEFIKNNGYTEYKVNPQVELKDESFELYPANEEKLKHRCNTLKPKAAGAKFDQNKWIVGFEYAAPAGNKNTGRAVVMDADGKNIQVKHQDFFLDSLKEHQITGLDKTRIKLKDREITLTNEDAREIGDALKDYLKNIKHPDKKFLISTVKSSGYIDNKGILRVDQWTLREAGGKLTLFHRKTDHLSFFAVTLERKNGEWTIKNIEEGAELPLQGESTENKTKEEALAEAVALISCPLNERLFKDKTPTILKERVSWNFSDERGKEIWDALIKAKYIDGSGVILPNFNPKKFKPPISLTPEEKKEVFAVMAIELVDKFPPEIVQKISPPTVKNVTKAGDVYKVILYSLDIADLEIPYKQESIIKWEATIGKGIRKIESKGVVWTTRRTYVY